MTEQEKRLAGKLYYPPDPELTEACIYEIQSLQARMNYLVRKIKELDRCAAAAARTAGRARWT